MFKEIDLESKISYLSGFLFTSSTMILNNVNEILMITVTGFIGGFFGLLGKDLYNFVKEKIKKR